MSDGEITQAPPAAICRLSARVFECWVAGLVMVLGCVVLAGWALGVQRLVDLVPGTAYMKPNTAVAFIISGFGLFLLQSPGKWRRIAVRFCALVVGMIALLTMGEYASGLDFGIDQLLFPIVDPDLMKPHLGRMSPQAASCFGQTAVALGLMSRPLGSIHRPLILGVVGMLMGAIALFYLFEHAIFLFFDYGRGDLSGMAIHTSLLFFLIATVILVTAWREAGWRWLIGHKLSAGIACGLVMMIAFAAFSQRSTKQLVAAATQVAHTYEVIGEIHQVKANFEEVEEGTRGFVITGDEDFLILTNRAILRMSENLEQLQQLKAKNSKQLARFAVLMPTIATSFEFSKQIIAARHDGDFGAAAQQVVSGRVRGQSDRVRSLLREMEVAEEQLLVSRQAASEEIKKWTLFIFPTGALGSVLIVISGVLLLNAESANSHRVTRELQRSDLRLRFALESSRIGEWEFDLTTNTVLRRSLMHDQIFGYTEKLPEWTYELFLKHVHPEDLTRVDQIFQETVATGRDLEFECRIIRHDGSEGWIWVRGNCLRDSNGQLQEMIGLIGDVTERKQAQEAQQKNAERLRALEEARQLNNLLEQRVRERTAKLEAAVEALDAFTYSVSHDLRAPLRAIDGFSRMVAEDYAERLDEDGQRMLNVIRKETLRMSSLIDDLLAFSRLGRQQIAPELIDMRAMAQDVFDELAAMAPERKLRLDLQPLPPALGTPAMIRQAWTNLLSNAIKFTKGRELGVIEIGTQEGVDGVPIYFVKDNGAGFDMRHAGKLFGVFERLHSAEEYEGTGVGLSLVKRVIQRHGGRIWAEAEVNCGATFYFTLPDPMNTKSADEMNAQLGEHHE